MFTDLNENTYTNAIKFVIESEIMKVYPDGSFRPNEPVTVAEFCRMIHILGQGKENVNQYNGFNSNYSYDIRQLNKESIDKFYMEDLKYIEIMTQSFSKDKNKKHIKSLLLQSNSCINSNDAINILELFFCNIIYDYEGEEYVFDKIKYTKIDTNYVRIDIFSRGICCELLYRYILFFLSGVLNAENDYIEKSIQYWEQHCYFNIYEFSKRILTTLNNINVRVHINKVMEYILFNNVDIKNCQITSLIINELIKIENDIDLHLKNKVFTDGHAYHYTSLTSLYHMLSKSNNSKNFEQPNIYLNASNIIYLNDPQEGKLHQEHISSSLNNKDIDVDVNNAYIICFCKNNKERLPMWVQYADNAKGCRIEFEIPKRIKTYSVDYKENLNTPEVVNYLIKIYNDENNDSIKKYIYNRLQEVEYYYKDVYYSHEDEIRYILNASPQNALEYDFIREGEYFPRLYCETPYPFLIKSVMLGPKCPNPEQVILYLKRMGVPEVYKSNIKFQ